MPTIKSVIRPMLPKAFKRAYYWRLAQGEPEADLKRCLLEMHEGQTIVDVGANIGTYTVASARKVGMGGHVLSFEPIPETYEYLSHTVARLALTNVYCFRMAIGGSDGFRKMTIPEWASGGPNFYEARFSDDGEVETLTMKLSTILQGIRPSFIKVDVEGADFEVVSSGLELVSECRPKWMVEVTDERTTKLLASCGYTVIPLSNSNVLFL